MSNKIPFSNVVVKRKKRAYWMRKWRSWDLGRAALLVFPHVLCLFAPVSCSWGAFWVALALAFITGLFGISISYHRNLAHKALKLPKWLEYLFAYCGVLAFQGDPIFWVSMHRYHHKFVDKEQDPHSPIEGFWFSHINWIYDTDFIIQKCGGFKNVRDLREQAFYRFLQATQLAHLVTLGLLLYFMGGFSFVVWGLGVRTVVAFHVTFLVNSACHIWGYQAWNTGDLSKNNWWVALLSFGEGWHNNHHAFEFSARHGHEWWQLDMGWYVIKLLERIGLASDVKIPSESQKQRMALKNHQELVMNHAEVD